MAASTVLPEPVPPEDWECCGSGCGDACVWEIYYRDKAAYDAQRRAAVLPKTVLSGSSASHQDEAANGVSGSMKDTG